MKVMKNKSQLLVFLMFFIPVIGYSLSPLKTQDQNLRPKKVPVETETEEKQVKVKKIDKVAPAHNNNESFEPENKFIYMANDVNKLEVAKDMVIHMAKDSKLRRLDVKDIVVVQGTYRTFPLAFNKLIEELLVNELSKNKFLKIHHFDRVPQIRVKGTPTSLKITKNNLKDIANIAENVGADAVLLWDIFNFEEHIYLTARMIRIYDNEVLWHYQNNEILLKKKIFQDSEVSKYKVQDRSSISIGATFMNNYTGFKRKLSTTGESAGASEELLKWTGGLDISYYSNIADHPRLSFGMNYLLLSSIGSEIDMSVNHVFFNARLQLNKPVMPLIDEYTGKVLVERDQRKFMLGFGVGYASLGADGAENFTDTNPFSSKTKPTFALKAFLDMQFIKRIEYQVGFIYYHDSTVPLSDTKNYYKDNDLNLDGINFFMSAKYKFNLDLDFK
jgi:TolB-like protein